jgi:hypothetical protein
MPDAMAGRIVIDQGAGQQAEHRGISALPFSTRGASRLHHSGLAHVPPPV